MIKDQSTGSIIVFPVKQVLGLWSYLGRCCKHWCHSPRMRRLHCGLVVVTLYFTFDSHCVDALMTLIL